MQHQNSEFVYDTLLVMVILIVSKKIRSASKCVLLRNSYMTACDFQKLFPYFSVHLQYDCKCIECFTAVYPKALPWGLCSL